MAVYSSLAKLMWMNVSEKLPFFSVHQRMHQLDLIEIHLYSWKIKHEYKAFDIGRNTHTYTSINLWYLFDKDRSIMRALNVASCEHEKSTKIWTNFDIYNISLPCCEKIFVRVLAVQNALKYNLISMCLSSIIFADNFNSIIFI